MQYKTIILRKGGKYNKSENKNMSLQETIFLIGFWMRPS